MPSIGLMHNGRIAELVDYPELLGTMMFHSDSPKHRDFVLQLVEAIIKQPPDGKIARQKWNLQMSRFSESGMSLSELRQILFRLLPSQLTSKSLAEEGLTNFGKGLVAGQILAILIRLADTAPALATLNKARHLAIAKLRKHVLAPNGEPKVDAPLSVRAIKDVWAKFKPVCHLYAAFAVLSDEHARDAKSGELSRQTMRRLLAIAEWYRSRGQDHRSPGSSAPTLNETEMWTVPANIDLKDVDVSFRPIWLTRTDLFELNNYKHD
jgi:hypothetical protein